MPYLGQFLRAAASIAILCTFVACATENVAYRTAFKESSDIALCTDPCSDSLVKLADSSSTTHAAHIAFIEFEDQGYLYNRQSKNEILKWIEDRAKQKPLLIVVFAHGWKHNASSTDQNVADFQKILVRLAEVDATACSLAKEENCNEREVVGVYLGWRGMYFEQEPLKELSFWSRKSRAHRVGIDGATEVIAQLGAIRFGESESKPANPANRLVLVGHSFGGALIYSATQQILMRDTFKQNANGEIPSSLADLVILVNPAFEAARFHALHSRLEDIQETTKFAVSQLPLFAVFTSCSDEATDGLFHMGRGLSTSWMPTTTVIGSDGKPEFEQHAQNTTSLGKYEPWVTHRLRRTKSVAEEPKLNGVATDCRDDIPSSRVAGSIQHSLSGWQPFSTGESLAWEVGDTSLEWVKKPLENQGQNPYMLVQVDDDVICHHNGIWGSSFSGFLYDFIAIHDARQITTATSPSRPVDFSHLAKTCKAKVEKGIGPTK